MQVFFFLFHFLSFIIEKKKIHILTIFRLHKTTHVFTIEFHLFLYLILISRYMITTLRYTFHLFETTITLHIRFYNISTGPIWLHRMKNVCMHIFLLNELSFSLGFSDTESSTPESLNSFQNRPCNEKHYGEYHCAAFQFGVPHPGERWASLGGFRQNKIQISERVSKHDTFTQKNRNLQVLISTSHFHYVLCVWNIIHSMHSLYSCCVLWYLHFQYFDCSGFQFPHF